MKVKYIEVANEFLLRLLSGKQKIDRSHGVPYDAEIVRVDDEASRQGVFRAYITSSSFVNLGEGYAVPKQDVTCYTFDKPRGKSIGILSHCSNVL